MTAVTRPVAVDTELARIWEATAKADNDLMNALTGVHWKLKEKPVYTGRRRGWPTTDSEAEATFRARLAAGDMPSWDRSGWDYTANAIDTARASIAALRAEARPLEAEFDRDRWSRFFLVTNSNGHIHKSRSCATTFPTTRWAWLPDLSGLTEADAVASQGPRLCSVCFPSAPVEWTLGLPKADKCPGSGAHVEANNPRAWKRYGTCPVCRKVFALSSLGAIRAHKPEVAK